MFNYNQLEPFGGSWEEVDVGTELFSWPIWAASWRGERCCPLFAFNSASCWHKWCRWYLQLYCSISDSTTQTQAPAFPSLRSELNHLFSNLFGLVPLLERARGEENWNRICGRGNGEGRGREDLTLHAEISMKFQSQKLKVPRNPFFLQWYGVNFSPDYSTFGSFPVFSFLCFIDSWWDHVNCL